MSVAVTLKDVLDCFEFHCNDQNGLSRTDWKKRICEGDAIYNIMKILAGDRNNPAYSKIMNEIESEVEGWEL